MPSRQTAPDTDPDAEATAIVADWPPLTRTQRDRLARIFNATDAPDDAA